MYYINVKERFDVRFMIKPPIFSRQGFNIFQARSVFEGTSYRLRVLAMLSFSVIICYSAIEIGLYSLYREKVIAAFKLIKKIVRSKSSFPRKKKTKQKKTRSFVSRKPSRLEKATILYVHALASAR